MTSNGNTTMSPIIFQNLSRDEIIDLRRSIVQTIRLIDKELGWETRMVRHRATEARRAGGLSVTKRRLDRIP